MASVEDIVTLGIGVDSRAAKTGANEAEVAIDKMGKTATEAEHRVKKTSTQMQEAGGSARSLAKAIGGLVAGFGALAAIRNVLGVLVEFEQGLVGVAKTTDFTAEETRIFGEEIIALSTKVPVATRELLAIGQAAGQLGVKGISNVLAFTDTVAKLGTATDLAGDEAATVLARMLNVTGESMSSVGTLGSVLVALGNTSAATESEIARTANQVALSTSVFKTSSAEAAALGATYASLGVRAELAGSATGRAFRMIDDAVRNGGEKMKVLEQITGKTGEEIKQAFQENSVSAFQLFIEGLGRVVEGGGDAAAILEQLGLSGEEVLKTIPTLAKRSALLGTSLKTAYAEVKNGTALNKEAERAFDTLGSKWQVFKNTVAAAKLQLRDSNGVLGELVEVGTGVLKILLGMTDGVEGGVTPAMKNLAFAVKAGSAALGVFLAVNYVPVLLTWSTATKSLSAALLVVAGQALAAGAVLVGALTGFALGNYFYDEFKQVQQTMAAFIANATDLWTNFVATMKRLWESARLTIASILNPEATAQALGITQENMVKGLKERNPGIADLYDEMYNRQQTTNNENKSAMEKLGAAMAEGIKDDMKAITQEQTAALKASNDLFEATMAEIENEFGGKSRKGNNFFEDLPNILKRSVNELTTLRDAFIGLGEVSPTVLPTTTNEAAAGGGAQEPWFTDPAKAATAVDSLKKVRKEMEDVDEATRDAQRAADSMGHDLAHAVGGLTSDIEDLNSGLQRLLERILDILFLQPAIDALANSLSQMLQGSGFFGGGTGGMPNDAGGGGGIPGPPGGGGGLANWNGGNGFVFTAPTAPEGGRGNQLPQNNQPGNVFNISAPINITTNRPNEFMESSKQIAARVESEMRRAAERASTRGRK